MTSQHQMHRGTMRRRRGALACCAIGCSVLYFQSSPSSKTMGRFLSTEGDSRKDASTNRRPLLKLLAGGGRLGDQLFMYASQLGLAKTHDMDSCMVKTHGWMDGRLAIEQLFVGPIEWCNDEEYDIEWVGGWRNEKISQLRRVDDDADLVYGLSGYMHSPRNFVAAKTPGGEFIDYSDLLYEKLTLHADAKWQNAIEEIMKEGERYEDESTEVIPVGIHVRRGDKVDNPHYTVADADYYQRAMDYLRTKYNRDCENSTETDVCRRKRVKFYISTDTMSWIDENEETFWKQPDVVEFRQRRKGDERNIIIDFAMLTKCKHIILSGGGFGFWAAFLGAHQNGGEVIIGSAQEPLKTRVHVSSLDEWTNIDELKFDAVDTAAIE